MSEKMTVEQIIKQYYGDNSVPKQITAALASAKHEGREEMRSQIEKGLESIENSYLTSNCASAFGAMRREALEMARSLKSNQPPDSLPTPPPQQDGSAPWVPKVNELVQIVSNKSGHKLKIGEIVKVKSFNGLVATLCHLDRHDFWYVNLCDIKPVSTREKEFTVEEAVSNNLSASAVVILPLVAEAVCAAKREEAERWERELKSWRTNWKDHRSMTEVFNALMSPHLTKPLLWQHKEGRPNTVPMGQRRSLDIRQRQCNGYRWR